MLLVYRAYTVASLVASLELTCLFSAESKHTTQSIQSQQPLEQLPVSMLIAVAVAITSLSGTAQASPLPVHVYILSLLFALVYKVYMHYN